MSRGHRIGLAILAGISLGAGVLLWLAIATDRLPGGGALIALGAVVIAAAAQIPIFLSSRRTSGACAQGGDASSGSSHAGP